MLATGDAVTDVHIPFEHRQTAHCESGVISALLRDKNVAMSEAMAFGIAAGLTFAYIPMVKLGGMPLIAYRMPPRRIIRELTRRLGITMASETFSSPAAGMRALDAHLAAGRVVGLQTSVFWLTYFPPDMRFHFNAHNLIVHGKRGDQYLISDPVMDTPVECDAASLQKARFVKGALAPKGLLYYPARIPATLNLPKAITQAIRFCTGMMLYTPLPIIGVRGIRLVARKIRGLPPADSRRNKLFMGHMVRMQEEIGTGGAGFRFLYAAFLQQAADVLNRPALVDVAAELTAAGDEWRRFALWAAMMCKDRMPTNLGQLADQLLTCANMERTVYKRLRKEVA